MLKHFKALVRASLLFKENSTAIQRSTRGIAFFSTPHQGGNGAVLADVFSNIGLFLLRNPSNDFLRTLKRNSDLMVKLADDFRNAAKYIHFVSFYETLLVKMVKILKFAIVQGIVRSPLYSKQNLF